MPYPITASESPLVKHHRLGARLVCVSHLFRPCLGVVYMYSLSPTYFSMHQFHHHLSMVLIHNLIPIEERFHEKPMAWDCIVRDCGREFYIERDI